MPYINPTTPEGFNQLVDKRAEEGNIEWLVRELKERMRINVGLVAQNSEWQRKMTAVQRGCSYTDLDGNRCGEFVDNPMCDRHKPYEDLG